MFNKEEVQTVAQENNTSKVIFNQLSKRLRFRRQTNLTNFHNELIHSGEKIIEDEFMETFKRLQTLGIGALIHGRNGKPNRFKWNYNLKEVAKVGTNGIAVVDMNPAPIKRGPGRPRKTPITLKAPRIFKSSPEVPTALKSEPSAISITLQIGGNSRPEDIAALLDLAKQLK